MVCKGLLVLTPTEHILRGFVLEPTSARDTVKVWRIVLPLYLRAANLNLSYSEESRWLRLNRDDWQGSADMVFDLIAGHVEALRAVRQPADFLRYFLAGGGCHRGVWSDFDRALTHYMIGDIDQAVTMLRAFDAGFDRARPGSDYVVPVIDRVMHEIETNPLGLAPLLKEWEDAQVAALGLQPSRAATMA